MDELNNIEETEEFLLINNNISEYIKKNFKKGNSLSTNVNNLKNLINFIKSNNYEYFMIDVDLLIENAKILKDCVEIISKNEELNNLFINSENKNISNFYKKVLNYNDYDKPDSYGASNDIVHDYLKELKFPLLSDENLRILYEKKNQGDINARNKIIESNLRLVITVAKKYIDRGMPFMDIIGYGNIGLIKAVDKFDINKGYKFSTYAIYWIRQSIIRSLENYSRIVRVPTYLHNDIQKYKYISTDFYNKNGRYPDVYEISELMNKSIGEVIKILKLNQGMIYLDEPIGEDKNATIGDLIEDNTNLEEDNVLKEYYSEFMEAFNNSNLREKEKAVLLHRNGFYNDKVETLDEIGKMYGVTRERIRQIEAKGLKKLRQNPNIRKYKNINV